MSGSLGDLYIRLGFANEEEFLATLKGLLAQGEAEAGRSGRKAGQSWTDALKASILGGAIGAAFTTVFIQASEAARRFVATSVDEFARMERAMAVASMSGVENIQALRQEITALAREAGLVAESDVAVAVAELTKAGLSAADAVAVLRSGLTLAVADMDVATGSIANAAQTATTLNGVLRSFGLSAADAGRASDILAAAAAASAASLSDMIEATSDIAPLAAQAGLGLNELTATIATLTNQNIPAAEAARGLRSVLASLIDPPAQVREQFQALGLTVLKADGTIRPFSEVLQNLKRVADSGGAGLKLLSQGMDQFALATALAIGRASEDIRSLSNELANSEGAARRMADAMRQTLTAQMEEARARTRDAARELGDALAPILIHLYSNVLPPVIRGLRDLTQALAEVAGVASKGDRLLQIATQTYGRYADPERAKAILVELDRLTAQLEAKETALKGFSQFALTTDPVLKRKQEEVAQLKERIAQLRAELIALQRAGAQAPPSPQPKQATPTPTALPLPTLPATGKREEDAVVKAANRLGQEIDVLRSRFERGAISQAQYEQGIARIRNELAALEKQVGGSIERAAAVEQVYQALANASKRVGSALDGLRDRLSALTVRYELGRITLEEYAGGLAKLEKEAKATLKGDELDRYLLAIKRARDNIARLRQEQDEALRRASAMTEQERLRRTAAAEHMLASEEEVARALQREIELLSQEAGALTESERARRASASAFKAQSEAIARAVAALEAELARIALHKNVLQDITPDEAAKQEIDALAKAIERLAAAGLDVADPAMAALIERYRALTEAAREAAAAQDELLRTAEEAGRLTPSERSRRGIPGPTTEAQQVIARLNADLAAIATRARVLGDEVSGLEEALRRANEALVELARLGLPETADEVVAVRNEIAALEEALGRLKQASAMTPAEESRRAVTAAWAEDTARLREAQEQVRATLERLSQAEQEATARTLVLGEAFDAGAYLIRAYQEAIVRLILLGLEPASEEIQRLQERLQALQEQVAASRMTAGEQSRRAVAKAFQEAGTSQVVDELAARLEEAVGRALASGLQSGDILGELQRIFRQAGQDLALILYQDVLAPFVQDLAKAISQAVGDAIGGRLGQELGTLAGGLIGGALGAIAGGLIGMLVGGLFSWLTRGQTAGGTSDKPPPGQVGAAAANRAQSSAPSITYHAETHLSITLEGGLNDPVVRAQVRSLAEDVTINTLRKLGLIGAGGRA